MRNVKSAAALGAVHTSVDPKDLAQYQQDAAQSERHRVLRGIRVLTPEGVQKVQMGSNSSHQLMVNTGDKRTYVQPHRHPLKWEYFSMEEVGKGKVKIICFNEAGKVAAVQYLIPGRDSSYTIPVGVYHTAVFMEDGTQFEEIKPGEFVAESDKEAPSWAPAENTPESLEFHRWLEICTPGEEAANSHAIVMNHYHHDLEEVSAKQQEILRTNEAIQQQQKRLLSAQTEIQHQGQQFLPALFGAVSGATSCPTEGGSCAQGAWSFLVERLFSLDSASSKTLNVNVKVDVNVSLVGSGPQLFGGRTPAQAKMQADPTSSPQIEIIPDHSDSPVSWCGLLGH